MYTLIFGSLSIGLVYFIPEFWRDPAVYSVIGLAVLVSIKNYFVDDPQFYAQLSPVRGPEERDATVSADETSAYYYTLGVIVFGVLYLVVL